MNIILNELEKIKILNESDIIKIKTYIHKKYPEKTETENEIILSDAINKVIYKSLQGLPEALKASVKNNVIKNTLYKDQLSITFCDIFKACIIEEKIVKDFTKELISWVELNAKIEVTSEDINSNIIIKKDLELLNEVNIKESLPHLKKLKRVVGTALMVIFIISSYKAVRYVYFNKQEEKVENYIVESDKKENVLTKYPNLHLPQYMTYKEINKEKLKDFLSKRESILVEEPYFSTIVSVAEEFNLNPIILFAITGQEQSFVPKSHKNADKIANNPFNVYYSWKEYNTDINDAARIAARTVINLSENRPEDKDPFLWIGRKYAEDKNWGKGVRLIFEELIEYTK